jgi:hypothetical protein
MASRIAQWTLDVHDIDVMAAFWSAALDYRVDRNPDGVVHLLPPQGSPDTLTIWLQPTTEPKTGKNRGHLDLVAVDGDVAAEIDRLTALGAKRIQIGQTGAEPFVVLADPRATSSASSNAAIYDQLRRPTPTGEP